MRRMSGSRRASCALVSPVADTAASGARSMAASVSIKPAAPRRVRVGLAGWRGGGVVGWRGGDRRCFVRRLRLSALHHPTTALPHHLTARHASAQLAAGGVDLRALALAHLD